MIHFCVDNIMWEALNCDSMCVHVYTCIYICVCVCLCVYYSPGLFACRLSEKTYSLWGYMWSHLDEYINPLYQSDSHDGVLLPNTDIPHLR